MLSLRNENKDNSYLAPARRRDGFQYSTRRLMRIERHSSMSARVLNAFNFACKDPDVELLKYEKE